MKIQEEKKRWEASTLQKVIDKRAERIVGRNLFPQYSYNGHGAFVHPSYSTYIK